MDTKKRKIVSISVMVLFAIVSFYFREKNVFILSLWVLFAMRLLSDTVYSISQNKLSKKKDGLLSVAGIAFYSVVTLLFVV